MASPGRYLVLGPPGCRTDPPVEGIFSPVRSGIAEEDILEGRVADVTGWRHLEEQLRHAQKMEALG